MLQASFRLVSFWTTKLLLLFIFAFPSFCRLNQSQTPSPEDYVAITQLLSHYAITIDTKEWSALSSIFTKDVVADYGILGTSTSFSQLHDTLATVFSDDVQTHHALSTQFISVFSTSDVGNSSERGIRKMDVKKMANATTYFTSQQFGTKEHDNEGVALVGRYEDQLVCQNGQVEGKRGDSVIQGTGGSQHQIKSKKDFDGGLWTWIYGGSGLADENSKGNGGANSNLEGQELPGMVTTARCLWRIKRRRVILMGPMIGNASIFGA
jgi:hypothetical protein